MNFKRTFLLVLKILNIASMGLMFYLMWMHSFEDLQFFRKGNYLLAILYVVLLAIITNLYGGYKIGDMSERNLIYSNVLALLIMNVVYYFQISLLSRELVSVRPFLILQIEEIVIAILWAYFANAIYFRFYKARRLIYLYQYVQSDVRRRMSENSNKYHLVDSVAIDADTDIVELVKAYDGVVLDRVDSDIRDKVISQCYSIYKRLYLVPDYSNILVESALPMFISDIPVYLLKNRGLSYEQKLVKRAFDIVISLIGILIASPIMLLTAVAIKLEDGGPILYKQERLTYHGRIFSVVKFRSMIVDAERGKAVLMKKNDSRITRVGNFIRKCRIDELPQLFNILAGDMSLIGPRPERPEIAKEYEKVMPEFRYRLNAQAGLTGYAQVYGRYNTTPQDKLAFDLMYIENYSFLIDLKILFLTVKVVLTPEAAEGVGENQSNAMKV